MSREPANLILQESVEARLTELSRRYKNNRVLAKEIGVSPQQLAVWMTGVNLPSLSYLYAICRATHASADWLMGMRSHDPLSEEAMCAIRELGAESRKTLEWLLTGGRRKLQLVLRITNCFRESEERGQ